MNILSRWRLFVCVEYNTHLVSFSKMERASDGEQRERESYCFLLRQEHMLYDANCMKSNIEMKGVLRACLFFLNYDKLEKFRQTPPTTPNYTCFSQ